VEYGLYLSGTCGIRIISIRDMWNKDYIYQGLVEKGLDISGTCGIRIRYIRDLWNKY